MTKADTDTVFVAITTGVATVNGEKIPFSKDKTFVRAGHPLLKSCPTYFVAYGEFLDWQPKR
jgi:hypothetical protein